ncbi:hypothetical protein ACJ72_05299 [Emergomyces africanus]|uniref:Uncharacterized protein n=1 Tax=Emergomyces africanus TaxID=1955775 RepID=A0A1B7NUC1_9EURO|nr:hypothetical protein ACJ72_05299 [Emergomyces africanus]
MKLLVVFLTLMTASVWAAAIPGPEPEPAVENPNEAECKYYSLFYPLTSSGNGGALAPVKVVSGLQSTATMGCAAVDLELQASGSCILFVLFLALQA